MARKLTGKEVVVALNEEIKGEVAALRGDGCVPTLAIFRIGAQPDAISYEQGAVKRCEGLGIETLSMVLPESVTQEEALAGIETLNRDRRVHGILMLQPFPSHIDGQALQRALAFEKDVDGITEGSLYGVFAGVEQGFPPCTAQACISMLRHYEFPIEGKRAVIVGRSLVVGRPLAMMLMKLGATVTLCHSKTADLPGECRRAELLIAAVGEEKLVDGSCMAPGQVILDVGINVNGDGKLCGDVDHQAAEELVHAISPVPGGVGTVTTAVLAKHIVTAARRALEREKNMQGAQ